MSLLLFAARAEGADPTPIELLLHSALEANNSAEVYRLLDVISHRTEAISNPSKETAETVTKITFGTTDMLWSVMTNVAARKEVKNVHLLAQYIINYEAVLIATLPKASKIDDFVVALKKLGEHPEIAKAKESQNPQITERSNSIQELRNRFELAALRSAPNRKDYARRLMILLNRSHQNPRGSDNLMQEILTTNNTLDFQRRYSCSPRVLLVEIFAIDAHERVKSGSLASVASIVSTFTDNPGEQTPTPGQLTHVTDEIRHLRRSYSSEGIPADIDSALTSLETVMKPYAPANRPAPGRFKRFMQFCFVSLGTLAGLSLTIPR